MVFLHHVVQVELVEYAFRVVSGDFLQACFHEFQPLFRQSFGVDLQFAAFDGLSLRRTSCNEGFQHLAQLCGIRTEMVCRQVGSGIRCGKVVKTYRISFGSDGEYADALSGLEGDAPVIFRDSGDDIVV